MFACFWNELNFQPSSKQGVGGSSLSNFRDTSLSQEILLETLRPLLSPQKWESPPHLVPTDSICNYQTNEDMPLYVSRQKQ